MMGGNRGYFIEKTDRWCAVPGDRDRLCLCESPHENMTPQCICYSMALPKRG